MKGGVRGVLRLLRPSTWRTRPVVVRSYAEYERIFGSTPWPLVEWWTGVKRRPGESDQEFADRVVEHLKPKDYGRQVLAEAWWALTEQERIKVAHELAPFRAHGPGSMHEALDKVVGDAG